MNADKLNEALTNVRADYILDAAESGGAGETVPARKAAKRRRTWRLGGIAAAALALALILSEALGGGATAVKVQALETAVYPQQAAYPEEPKSEADYEAWQKAEEAYQQDWTQRFSFRNAAADTKAFDMKIMKTFLSASEGKNALVSPLSLYMALAMLAELTEGDSRQEILDALGAPDTETLRTSANALWNYLYRDDGAVALIPAASLWLGDRIDGSRDCLKVLAEQYYASSFRGEMGSEAFNGALQQWIGEQTGGLLKEYGGKLETDPETTLLMLVTTLYFRVKWENEFSVSDTENGLFHAAGRDLEAAYMKQTDEYGSYFVGEHFAAVPRALKDDSGIVWFILPDGGVSPEQLLEDPELEAFLSAGRDWEQKRSLKVNWSLPRFDISSEQKLEQGLKALGIQSCFEKEQADFSPLTEDKPVWLDSVRQACRVAADEEGLTAAAYTAMEVAGAPMPPEDEVDFVLDRPFLFAVENDSHILYAGIVNEP